MKKLMLLAVLVALMCSCNGNKFKVSGTVEGAGDTTTLYLETTINGNWLFVDSVKTSAGKFAFTEDAAEYPNIYRLGYRDKNIYFPIDSIDNIEIKTSLAKFDEDYTLSGSDNAVKVMNIDKQAAKFSKEGDTSSDEITHHYWMMYFAHEILGADGLFFGQFIVLREDQAPEIGLREEERVILARIGGFTQHGEIQQPLVQLFRDLLRVAAGDVKTQAGAAALQRVQLPRQIADLIGFRQAEIQLAAGDIVQRQKLLFDLIRHRDEILRPVAQQNALLRQRDIEAVSGEELFAQFFLQRAHGAGERRLGDVQQLGGPGHVFLPRNGEKIPQGANLHEEASFPRNA